MRQAAQQLVAPVMVDDRLADHRAEPRHPIGQPLWDVAAMQRQIGASGFVSHQPDRSAVRGSGRGRVVLIQKNMASLLPCRNTAGVRRQTANAIASPISPSRLMSSIEDKRFILRSPGRVRIMLSCVGECVLIGQGWTGRSQWIR
jgi:hypothetical protein